MADIEHNSVCKHCENFDNLIIENENKSVTVHLIKGDIMKVLRIKVFGTEIILDINFCPFCGRKL